MTLSVFGCGPFAGREVVEDFVTAVVVGCFGADASVGVVQVVVHFFVEPVLFGDLIWFEGDTLATFFVEFHEAVEIRLVFLVLRSSFGVARFLGGGADIACIGDVELFEQVDGVVGEEIMILRFDLEFAQDFFGHPLEWEPVEEPLSEGFFILPLPADGLDGRFCPVHEGGPFTAVVADHFSEGLAAFFGEFATREEGLNFGRFEERRTAVCLEFDVILDGTEDTLDGDERVTGFVAFDDVPGVLLPVSGLEDIFFAEDFDVDLMREIIIAGEEAEFSDDADFFAGSDVDFCEDDITAEEGAFDAGFIGTVFDGCEVLRNAFFDTTVVFIEIIFDIRGNIVIVFE